MGRFY